MCQSTGNFLSLSWFFLFSGPASQSCILRTHVLIGSLYYLLCRKLHRHVPLSMEPRIISVSF